VIYLSGQVQEAAARVPGIGFMVSPEMGNRIPTGSPFALDNGAYGCYLRGETFDCDRWLRWLAKQPREGCLFAAAPDLMGHDCWESFEFSYPHLERIRSLGFRAALVAQDSFETIDDTNWKEDDSFETPFEHLLYAADDGFSDSFDTLFIGGGLVCADEGPGLDQARRPSGGCDCRQLEQGSRNCPVCGADAVEWKESDGALLMARWAVVSGKTVHMGRVNSWRRMLLAARAGVSSVDGRMLCYGPDVNLPIVEGWLRRLDGEAAQMDLFGEVAA
jgi:hypothetical protein